MESLNTALPSVLYRREALPLGAGFLAGKAFLAYKHRGGNRHTPLPDFYIGAHAAIEELALLTRDVARYRTKSLSANRDCLSPTCEGCCDVEQSLEADLCFLEADQ